MRSRVHDTLDTASQMIHDKFCGGVCSAAHLEIESLRDAQATIAALQEEVDSYKSALRDFETERALPLSIENAALQARVRELEQWVQDQSTANLETMRHTDEMQSRAMEAEQQLTQRTAERDTARRRVDELEAREVDVVLLREDLEQRTAELEAANDKVQFLEKKNRNLLDSENLTLKVKADQDVRLADLQAELERVRGERDKLQSEVDGWELGSRVFP